MVKIKAADTIKTRQEYARFKVVRQAELKTMKAIAATLRPGPQLDALLSVITSAESELRLLKDQITILRGMGDA